MSFIFGCALSACSSSSGTSGSKERTDGGDSEPNVADDAGMTTNDGKMAADAGGKVPVGPPDAAGSGGKDPVSTPDASVSGPGAASLGGSDGITGTFGGKTYAFTVSPLHVPQMTTTALISASVVTMGLPESWAIRFLPKLGTQECTGSDEVGDPAVSFRSLANTDLSGTTGSLGTCSITVTSLTPKYEGSFIATFVPIGGTTEKTMVTDGYFRIAQ